MNHRNNYYFGHYVVTDLSRNTPHTYMPIVKENEDVIKIGK